MESNNREYLSCFKAKIEGLDSATDSDLSSFYVGEEYWTFTNYIKPKNDGDNSEALNDSLSGSGVTHLMWNVADENNRELVGYFTVSAGALPYDDGIEDDEFDLSNYPNISVLEIKMFAVAEKYQDVFFVVEEDEMPIAAWCLIAILEYCDRLASKTVGFKALFLHSVESAEHFYNQNGFSNVPNAARPLFSVDQDLQAMWFPIRPVLLQDDEVINDDV